MSEEHAARRAAEQIATTVDGTLMTPAKADETRCDVLAPGSNARCCYRADHPPLVVQGAQYDHHAPGVVSWNVPAMPAPAPFCGQRDPNYPDDGTCTLPPGHPRWMDDGDGDVWDHARIEPSTGEMITAWNVPAVPAEPEPRTINDQRRAAGLPPWQMWEPMRIVDDAKPVRVRFIDLPPRYEHREVFGVTATVAVPGGFALVVDRFRHLAHLEGERERWESWGSGIGAHSVVLYPGELDIASWHDCE